MCLVYQNAGAEYTLWYMFINRTTRARTQTWSVSSRRVSSKWTNIIIERSSIVSYKTQSTNLVTYSELLLLSFLYLILVLKHRLDHVLFFSYSVGPVNRLKQRITVGQWSLPFSDVMKYACFIYFCLSIGQVTLDRLYWS